MYKVLSVGQPIANFNILHMYYLKHKSANSWLILTKKTSYKSHY